MGAIFSKHKISIYQLIIQLAGCVLFYFRSFYLIVLKCLFNFVLGNIVDILQYSIFVWMHTKLSFGLFTKTKS